MYKQFESLLSCAYLPSWSPCYLLWVLFSIAVCSDSSFATTAIPIPIVGWLLCCAVVLLNRLTRLGLLSVYRVSFLYLGCLWWLYYPQLSLLHSDLGCCLVDTVLPACRLGIYHLYCVIICWENHFCAFWFLGVFSAFAIFWNLSGSGWNLLGLFASNQLGLLVCHTLFESSFQGGSFCSICGIQSCFLL
jgi:hypothetical protein